MRLHRSSRGMNYYKTGRPLWGRPVFAPFFLTVRCCRFVFECLADVLHNLR